MKVSVKQNGELQILEVSGEIDFHTSQDLRQRFLALLEKKAPKIFVNLKKVSYIDSSGLATFVEALQRMKQYGGELTLAGLAPAVRGVFEIAKLDSIFTLVDSEGKG